MCVCRYIARVNIKIGIKLTRSEANKTWTMYQSRIETELETAAKPTTKAQDETHKTWSNSRARRRVTTNISICYALTLSKTIDASLFGWAVHACVPSFGSHWHHQSFACFFMFLMCCIISMFVNQVQNRNQIKIRNQWKQTQLQTTTLICSNTWNVQCKNRNSKHISKNSQTK